MSTLSVNRLENESKIFHATHWDFISNLVKDRAHSKLGPVVTLDLTKRCNYRCPHCTDQEYIRHGAQMDFDFTILQKLLSWLKENGVQGLEICGGGEPTLYSHFQEMVTLAGELGFRLGLVSNGSTLPVIGDVLARSEFDWIRFSMDAVDSATYSKLHGIADMQQFPRIFAAIEKLAHSSTATVGISFIVTPDNHATILQAVKAYRETGVRYVQFKPLVDGPTKRLLAYSPAECNRIKEQLLEGEKLVDESFKIIYPSSLTKVMTYAAAEKEVKQYNHCWIMYLRLLFTPVGVYPCPYHRGKDEWLFDQINATSLNVVNFWDWRERVFAELNPEMECKFHCIRDKANMALTVLDEINVKYPHPSLLNILRPIEFEGEDILWL